MDIIFNIEGRKDGFGNSALIIGIKDFHGESEVGFFDEEVNMIEIMGGIDNWGVWVALILIGRLIEIEGDGDMGVRAIEGGEGVKVVYFTGGVTIGAIIHLGY